MIKKIKNSVAWAYVITGLKRIGNCWNVLRKRIAKKKSKRL